MNFPPLKGKKILITGSKGFIGQHLIRELNKLNLEFTEFQGDIREGIKLEGNFDIVFHLAAKVPQKSTRANEFHTINEEGTKKVLEFCKEKKAKIIYPSTVGVYGAPEQEIVTESSKVFPDINKYAHSKYQGELACMGYAKQEGGSYVILRFSNIYGPNQTGRGLIPTLINAAKNNKIAQLRDKEGFRDFIYIKDAVTALLLSTKEEVKNKLINVGLGRTYKVEEVVEIIQKIYGKRINVRYSGRGENEVKGFGINISLAKEILGFNPQYSLEAGIKETLNS